LLGFVFQSSHAYLNKKSKNKNKKRKERYIRKNPPKKQKKVKK